MRPRSTRSQASRSSSSTPRAWKASPPSCGGGSATTFPRALARTRRLASLLLAAVVFSVGATACDSPPQVVAISPERGAQQVPSNADVSIRFDRPVDEASVASHFSVHPEVSGKVAWTSPAQLVFRHDPFRPSTAYTVRLNGGYRDAAGHVNSLNHGWSFRTEAAPVLTGSVPAAGEQNVDPAAFVTLAFSRPMDLASLASAVSISPAMRFVLRTDPADNRRTVVSPLTILDPGTSYSVTVTGDARDVDGNLIASGVTLEFATGAMRPLRHWVTFSAEGGGTNAGVWVVDESRLPRQVTPAPVSDFSWSLDGSHLLLRSPGGTWTDAEVGAGVQDLPFAGDWAAFLAPGLGYAVLDQEQLQVFRDGQVEAIDSGVRSVSVSPNGLSLAYAVATAAGYEVRGYQVELRSHYRLGQEPARVDSLAWAPDGSKLAYRLASADAGRHLLRVRDLAGPGGVRTVAIGAVSGPEWQADSKHLILAATVLGPQGPVSRAFRVSVSDSATIPLTLDAAIPDPSATAVADPVPSPDGHQVAFLAPDPGGDQVWLMNVDGTGLHQLTQYDPRSFPYSCKAVSWTRS
ncbi:MAG TPA: Ig-like domain-containing protein [Candidatus Dormibacteraeota bacterium]